MPKARACVRGVVSGISVCGDQHPSTSCFRARAQRNANKDSGGNKKASGGVLLVKGTSPIKLEILESWLADYPRPADAQYLLKGFLYCFRILALSLIHI